MRLGYNKPFGYWARSLIELAEHWLGCALLSGAAKGLRARECWIGWSDRQRLASRPWVLNHRRFLIIPGVQVPNLASHMLGQLAQQVGEDWQARWGYRPLLLLPSTQRSNRAMSQPSRRPGREEIKDRAERAPR